MKNFLTMGKHTTKFMFATVFFHVQEQMKRLEEDRMFSQAFSDGAERAKETITTSCHLGIALKIREERRITGTNSDYLLRSYGLFWDRCRLEAVAFTTVDGRVVFAERRTDGFYQFPDL
jgi:hypothetical protein